MKRILLAAGACCLIVACNPARTMPHNTPADPDQGDAPPADVSQRSVPEVASTLTSTSPKASEKYDHVMLRDLPEALTRLASHPDEDGQALFATQELYLQFRKQFDNHALEFQFQPRGAMDHVAPLDVLRDGKRAWFLSVSFETIDNGTNVPGRIRITQMSSTKRFEDAKARRFTHFEIAVPGDWTVFQTESSDQVVLHDPDLPIGITIYTRADYTAASIQDLLNRYQFTGRNPQPWSLPQSYWAEGPHAVDPEMHVLAIGTWRDGQYVQIVEASTNEAEWGFYSMELRQLLSSYRPNVSLKK